MLYYVEAASDRYEEITDSVLDAYPERYPEDGVYTPDELRHIITTHCDDVIEDILARNGWADAFEIKKNTPPMGVGENMEITYETTHRLAERVYCRITNVAGGAISLALFCEWKGTPHEGDFDQEITSVDFSNAVSLETALTIAKAVAFPARRGTAGALPRDENE